MNSNESAYRVNINTLDGLQFSIDITATTRAQEVVKKVAEKLELQYYEDFRLFLKDNLNQYRVVDSDEILYKMMIDQQAQ